MTIAIDKRTGAVVGQRIRPPWGGPEPVGLVRLLAPNHPNASAEGIVYIDAASVRLEEVE